MIFPIEDLNIRIPIMIPIKDLNVRIPLIIPISGRGVINDGSGLVALLLRSGCAFPRKRNAIPEELSQRRLEVGT